MERGKVSDMSYASNPDMIAFTVGRVALTAIANGSEALKEDIIRRLWEVERNGTTDRITPEMAASALHALCCDSQSFG